MNTNWFECPIGEVVTLQQGLCINKKSKHLLSDNGYPLLRITDLINHTETQYINKNKVYPKFLVQKSDLIYTRTGQVGLIFKNREGIVHNNCFTVTPNEKIDSQYLYWFLKTPFSLNYAKSVASGSSQPDLPHSAFKSMPFRYPKTLIQTKIASILSAYDDLIENNTRRIKILETMAQTIYQEWFVKFRFPGHEQVKMVESELGLIPKGWEVKKVTDAILVNPKTQVSKQGQKPFVPMGSLSTDSMLINDIESRTGNSGAKFKILF